MALYILNSNSAISTHDLTRRSTTFLSKQRIPLHISTHDLTRRSTGALNKQIPKEVVFQLTTSQGGRHELAKEIEELVDISTHDLTRRSTNTLMELRQPNGISTHDLTRRSTAYIIGEGLTDAAFQLTTSQGGRPFGTAAPISQ